MAAKSNGKAKPKTPRKVPAKRGRGRPDAWSKIGAEKILADTDLLCKMGAIDADLAAHFEVAESTIGNWKVEHPEFMETIKSAKMMADANVAGSLYRKAMGYERVIEKVGKAPDGSTITVTVTEYVEPDTASIIFWLKNRQRDKWNEKFEHVHSGQVNYRNLSEDELKEMPTGDLASNYVDLVNGKGH